MATESVSNDGVLADELDLARQRLESAQHDLADLRRRHSAELARLNEQYALAIHNLNNESRIVGIVRHGMPRLPSGEVIVVWERDEHGEKFGTIELMLPEHEVYQLLEAL